MFRIQWVQRQTMDPTPHGVSWRVARASILDTETAGASGAPGLARLVVIGT